jgi:hypothetical protein
MIEKLVPCHHNLISIFYYIPRIEAERLLLFDGLAEEPQPFENGLDDSIASGSATGEELDQRPAKSISVQATAKIFVPTDELVRRRLVHLLETNKKLKVELLFDRMEIELFN